MAKMVRTFKYEEKEVNGRKLKIRIPTHQGHKRPDCAAQCVYSVSDGCACRCGGENHGAGLRLGERMDAAWVKEHLHVDISKDKKADKKPAKKVTSLKAAQALVDATRVELKK